MHSSDNLLTCFLGIVLIKKVMVLMLWFIFCIYAFDPMLLMIYYSFYRS